MSRTQYIWILGICCMLTSGTLAGHFLHNLAQNQKAVQSSVNDNVGFADKAVDGKRDAEYIHGSCMTTKLESNPWWSVDLKNVYTIGAVTITNRAELENGLDGVEIWIGTSTEINDTESMRCAVISHIPSGRTLYFPCRSLEGRFVTLLLPGSEKVLSFCEVEVYYEYPLPNVALKGEATQSSTLSFAAASKAIDGRRNSFYPNGFCSHTAEDETNPWWRVDLKKSFIITSVKITNRGDCCAERLDGAEIRIGNSLDNYGNDNPRCALISQLKAGKTCTYQCDGGSMEGRFVNVIIPGQMNTLTLCEVEVYAARAVEPLPNVAFKKQTAQSSTGNSIGAPSKAVDGCRSGIYSNGCCTHTSNQQNPWWRVDLLAVYKVTAVTIINRQDCCASRLTGAEIRIGDSLIDNGNRNPRCGIISSLEGSPTYTFQCNEMEGRYVNIVIPGSNNILTLCEVEVFASLPVQEDVTPSPTPTPPPTPTVTMVLRDRNMTMVGKKLCWSDALIYCRHYHWDLLSIDSQEEQSELEQLLGYIPFSLTDYIWLGLRRAVRGDEWFWMSGEPMNFTKWLQGFAPYRYYSYTCGSMASAEHFLWDDKPCGEHLSFICQSDAEDSVQRVYFYSTINSTRP